MTKKRKTQEIQSLGMKEVCEIMASFTNQPVLNVMLSRNGVSNKNHIVTTRDGKYFLKIYLKQTDKIEMGVYAYLRDKINIPEVLFYDGTKDKFQYAFAILEYVDGFTFREYLHQRKMFKTDIVYEIGRMCATIHRKTYSEFAEVDENLEILKPMPSIDEQIYNLLNDKAGTYLQKETVRCLKNYLVTHEALCSQLNESSVLIHGDMRFNNILISQEKVYFLDFEFAHAGSRYMDIGHFFSRKDDEVESLMNEKVYDDFWHGYHEVSSVPLPENWLLLSRFCDICLMLRLINRDNSPAEWVSDIEQDIVSFVSESEIDFKIQRHGRKSG